MKCLSCSTIIGNRQVQYEKGLAEIDEKTFIGETEKKRLKTLLIDSLELKNYCCKMRIIGFKQKLDIIM